MEQDMMEQDMNGWGLHRTGRLRGDQARFYGVSTCKVNLNLTHLLKTGKINQAEFEKLRTFSKVGFEFHILNVLFGIVLFGAIFEPGFGRVFFFFSDTFAVSIVGPLFFLTLGLIYSFVDCQELVKRIGFLILTIIVGLCLGFMALL